MAKATFDSKGYIQFGGSSAAEPKNAENVVPDNIDEQFGELLEDQEFLKAAHENFQQVVLAFIHNDEVPGGGTVSWAFSLLPKLVALMDGNTSMVNQTKRDGMAYRGKLRLTQKDAGFVYKAAVRGGWEPTPKKAKKAPKKASKKASKKADKADEIEMLKNQVAAIAAALQNL